MVVTTHYFNREPLKNITINFNQISIVHWDQIKSCRRDDFGNVYLVTSRQGEILAHQPTNTTESDQLLCEILGIIIDLSWTTEQVAAISQ